MNLRTDKKNTIEFRAHGATHDPEKAKRWVNFLTAFVEASAANRAPKSFIEDRTPAYKFEKMSEWVRACVSSYRTSDPLDSNARHTDRRLSVGNSCGITITAAPTSFPESERSYRAVLQPPAPGASRRQAGGGCLSAPAREIRNHVDPCSVASSRTNSSSLLPGEAV